MSRRPALVLSALPARPFLLAVVSVLVAATAACGSDDPVLEPPTTSGPGTGGACSAAGLPSSPDEQPGLPDEVAETRRLLVGAATSCGYARLAHVAGRGAEPFTYSFGDEADPAGFWQREEADGGEPLRFLVELLDRPFVERDVPEGVQYVWPSAFGYETWSDVPPADRDALEPLYDETDFSFFESFGGYAGYRVGIASDGEWLFFVAGD